MAESIHESSLENVEDSDLLNLIACDTNVFMNIMENDEEDCFNEDKKLVQKMIESIETIQRNVIRRNELNKSFGTHRRTFAPKRTAKRRRYPLESSKRFKPEEEHNLVTPYKIEYPIEKVISEDIPFVQLDRFIAYIENDANFFAEAQFVETFHVKKDVFEYLVDLFCLQTVIDLGNTSSQRKHQARCHILVTLMYLGSNLAFKDISKTFGLPIFTIWTIVRRTIHWFCFMKDKYIVWPKNKRAFQETSEAFYNQTGAINVIGALSGTHIKVKTLQPLPQVYVNSNKYHSIILQVTTDAAGQITSVYCNMPGSYSYGDTLRTWPLLKLFTFPQYRVYSMVSTAAYPTYRWLVPPFKTGDPSPDDEKEYNDKHQQVVQPAIDALLKLKARFPRLCNLKLHDVKYARPIILAACILQNICLQLNDDSFFQLDYKDYANDIFEVELDTNHATEGVNRLKIFHKGGLTASYE